MKKIILFITALLLFNAGSVFAQKDPKAKKILDRVKTIFKSHKTVQANFTFAIENKAEKISETQKGRFFMQGNMFKVDMSERLIICDGKNIWTYDKETNEVQINNYNLAEDQLSPTRIFTLYDNGFNYTLVSEKGIEYVNLIPENKKKEISQVKLFFDKQKTKIERAIISNKDGNLYTYTIQQMETNKTFALDMFKFDKAKYPKVEIVDLRN